MTPTTSTTITDLDGNPDRDHGEEVDSGFGALAVAGGGAISLWERHQDG